MSNKHEPIKQIIYYRDDLGNFIFSGDREKRLFSFDIMKEPHFFYYEIPSEKCKDYDEDFNITRVTKVPLNKENHDFLLTAKTNHTLLLMSLVEILLTLMNGHLMEENKKIAKIMSTHLEI